MLSYYIMATYDPPIENLPIFDPSVFVVENTPLTYNQALGSFLAYPVAQGTEDLSIINVNGLATFNAAEIHQQTETHNGIVTFNNSDVHNATSTFNSSIIANNVITQNNAILNINQTDHTNNNLGNVLRATQIFGDLQLLRPSGVNGGAMQFTDITTQAYGNNFAQQYQTGTQFAIINQAPNGTILLRQRNALDTALRNLLNLTTTGSTMQRSASDGNHEVLALKEQDIGNTISLYPYAPVNTLLYNVANDNLITSRNSNTNTPNTTALTIGCQSNQNNGIRIDSVNNTVEMGQGGTASGVYTNSFSCSATTSTIKGPALFSSTTAPKSNQTLLPLNDTSNNIPTTQWVQSVIATIPTSVPLFIRAYSFEVPTVTNPLGVINVNFNGSAVNINDNFTLRYSIRYDYDTTTTGQSLYYLSYYGNMVVFPRRVITNNLSNVLLDGSISGNTTYQYNDATNAPLGRYVWTENYVTTNRQDPLNFATQPVRITFTDQTQIKFTFNAPYSPPATSTCVLAVSFEMINSCASVLTITSTNTNFSNVTKNF